MLCHLLERAVWLRPDPRFRSSQLQREGEEVEEMSGGGGHQRLHHLFICFFTHG